MSLKLINLAFQGTQPHVPLYSLFLIHKFITRVQERQYLNSRNATTGAYVVGNLYLNYLGIVKAQKANRNEVKVC